MKKTDYRVERDSIGVKDIPEDVYYGVQSLRAAENFHITGLNMHPEIINSLAYIKKAAPIVRWGFLRRKKHRRLSRHVMKLFQENSIMNLLWILFREELAHL